MLILLPPSERKKSGGTEGKASLSRETDKPMDIATTASEKDLKCTGKRYEEGIRLNSLVDQGPRMPAIDRYDGVMYRAIGYDTMSNDAQAFFNNNVGILSGMYGIVRPDDTIANYKLPVTTALKHFWKEKLTNYINNIESDLIVDLLPGSYRGMIDRKQINARVITVERHKSDGKKVAHGMKSIRGDWVRQLCENGGEGVDWSQETIIFTV